MNYIKVTCHIKNEDLDIVSSYIFSLGCLGTELVLSDFKNEILEDHYGEIYTLDNNDYPDTGVILNGYFDETINKEHLLTNIKQFIGKNNVELIDGLLTIEAMDDVDYENSWKDYYQEIVINDNVSIVPSWFETNSNKIQIKIEPGLGFGTGSHPTTFMCLSHVAKYIHSNDIVGDLGTGSGVIAILAKKLGASTVYGIDLDPEALKNAKHNGKLNFSDDIIWTSRSLNQINERFDLIVANIVFDVILLLLPEIKNSLNKNGLLIISGITKSQKNDIIKKLVESDFQLIEIEEMKDFVSFVFRK